MVILPYKDRLELLSKVPPTASNGISGKRTGLDGNIVNQGIQLY